MQSQMTKECRAKQEHFRIPRYRQLCNYSKSPLLFSHRENRFDTEVHNGLQRNDTSSGLLIHTLFTKPSR